jgi:hypothetical protein
MLTIAFMLFMCPQIQMAADATNAPPSAKETHGDGLQKIELNLDALDANGLRGPPRGKVAVSYEFVIPDTQNCRDEVKGIDATVQFMRGSSGRVGAGEGECLCIGSTHQRHYRKVLRALARCAYIERIVECHFE